VNKTGKTLLALLNGLRRRAILLYMAAAVGLLPFFHYAEALDQARSSTLNRYMPDFDYLIKLREREIPPDPVKIEGYYRYYKKVAHYLPNKADVLGILGYCSYYSGKKNEALGWYHQATVSFPFSFALFYNLGALHYEQQDYPTAIQNFKKALKMDFKQNLRFISASRIYFPLFKDPQHIDTELAEYMKLGYERCYKLLIVSLYRTGDFSQQLQYAAQILDSPVKDPAFFLFQAGLASFHLQNYNRAIVLLQKALQADPGDYLTMHYLGLALQKIGKDEIAEPILREAEKARGDDKASRMESPEVILQIF